MKACIEHGDLLSKEDLFLLVINLTSPNSTLWVQFPDLGVEGLQWLIAKDPLYDYIKTVIFEISFKIRSVGNLGSFRIRT